MTGPGIEPRSPGPLANTLPTKPANHRLKNQRKRKKRQGFRSCQRTKKIKEHESTMIPTVIGGLGTVPKFLERGLKKWEIGGQIETILTTALLRSARILRRVLEN